MTRKNGKKIVLVVAGCDIKAPAQVSHSAKDGVREVRIPAGSTGIFLGKSTSQGDHSDVLFEYGENAVAEMSVPSEAVAAL